MDEMLMNGRRNNEKRNKHQCFSRYKKYKNSDAHK